MRVLDYLARAGRAVAGWNDALPPEFSAAAEESLEALGQRCRAEGLPVRRVMWSSGGRGRRPWEREWLDARFLVPASCGDLVISSVLPEDAGGPPARVLGWWLGLVWRFHHLTGDGAPPGGAPVRTVRFVVAREAGRARGRPVFPAAWQGPGLRHEVEARTFGDGSVLLCAGGFAGALLRYFGARTPGALLSDARPLGAVKARFAPGSGEAAARVVLALALWWRYSGYRDASSVLSWLLQALPQGFWRGVAARSPSSSLTFEALWSHSLEACLGALHALAPALGGSADAEEEAAGWCREMEAAVRGLAPLAGGKPVRTGAPLASLRWPAGGPGFAGKLDAGRPYLSAPGFAEPGAWSAFFDWSRCAAARLRELADGERSLAEIALRLTVEFGIGWDEAVGAVSGAVKEGRLVPLERALTGRTLLYFSYGSCMSRQSFRESVPRFELVGEAALKGFRLAFTHRSAVRAGGVADVVPEEGSEVRGILYRIAWSDLAELDEREGVHAGRYQREWVEVEALGVRFSPVLTYTVVHKRPRDLPPSPEYAGLLADGARGMLDPRYVEELEALFRRLGVEPELP